MVYLNSSTNVALNNILSDVLLHIWSLIKVTQIMIHLVSSRVNGHLGVVSFIQNFSSKLITFGNHQLVLELHHTLFINAEMRTTPFGHQLLDMGNFQFILPLLSNNLLK
jgi:hypothetical protein